MKKIIRICAICALMLSNVTAHAETNSNTVSIEEGPSLQALTTPTWDSEPVGGMQIDPKFPEFLEAEGNYQGAVLEWYRIMHTTMNAAVKETALFEIALLYKRSKQYQKSLKTIDTYLGRYPESSRKTRALYIKSTLHDILSQQDAGIKARMELLQISPEDKWLEEAELHNIWSLAVIGANEYPAAITQRGIALQDKLKKYKTNATNHNIALITLSAFVPGLGHLMLEDHKKAAAMALLNILAMLAFISAMRHNQWSYSLLFGVLAGMVYLGNIYSANILAQERALEKRLDAMEQWEKLKPMDPVADPLHTTPININADLIGTRKPWQTY